ncbi:MAG: GIY-YIG nuclease family protein [Saprospiraceae bacterium]
MGFYTYILKNNLTNKYYTGSTENLEKRLERHNSGYVKSTKSGAPNWKIVYYEVYETRSEAQFREMAIKAKKSRKYIEFLING